MSPVDVREVLSVGDIRSSVAREERRNFKFELTQGLRMAGNEEARLQPGVVDTSPVGSTGRVLLGEARSQRVAKLGLPLSE